MKIREQLKQNHSQAYVWALQCCNFDEELAKDVLQDTYLKILEQKARFQGRSAFKTWLFAVIRNTSSDHFKTIQKHQEMLTSIQPQLNEQEDEPKAQTTVANVHRILQTLAPRQREVVTLVFYHELTIQEAADIMKISVGSARQHYDRGKKALKKQFNK